VIRDSDVIVTNVKPSDRDLEVIELIAHNTKNTWQRNRPMDEIRRDTALGKLAERSFINYLETEGIPHADWDDLRQDDYQSHTSLDGFIAHPESTICLQSDEFASRVNNELQGAYLSVHLRDELESEGVWSYEVKSTRITRRLRLNDTVNVSAILNDDFLAYPNTRSGVLDDRLETLLLTDKYRESAKEKSPFIFVRVYMTPPTLLTETVEARLIGWIDRDFFYANCMVKNMVQPGKSEAAIYYAVPIRRGRPMSELHDYIKNRSL